MYRSIGVIAHNYLAANGSNVFRLKIHFLNPSARSNKGVQANMNNQLANGSEWV